MLYSQSEVKMRDLFRDVAHARQAALLLDYDGTLAPFHRNRYMATPYPCISELLKDIMETGRTRLVVITGRRAQEVIPLLKLSPAPEVWGTHGLERLYTDGTYEPPEIDPYSSDALDAARVWAERFDLGDLVEKKPGSVAVHWRDLAEEKAAAIRNKVLMGWMSIADSACLTLEEFDGGVEMRLTGRNKGDAVRTILSEMDEYAPVAYLGDDQTDEDAFYALRDRGLRVLVRPYWRETAADVWLRPPVQLAAFLLDWLHACRLAPLNRPPAQRHLGQMRR